MKYKKGDFLISDYYGTGSYNKTLEIIAVGEILVIVKNLADEEICLRPSELDNYIHILKEEKEWIRK